MIDVRKVIDGKVYDTETAERICTIRNDFGDIYRDFTVERSALYRTKKGQWFVAGESGACGRWRKRGPNNGYEPGEGLELLTPDQARRCLEDADAPVELYFEVADG